MGNLAEDHNQALVSHHILAEEDTGPQVAGRHDNPLDSFSFPTVIKASKASSSRCGGGPPYGEYPP